MMPVNSRRHDPGPKPNLNETSAMSSTPSPSTTASRPASPVRAIPEGMHTVTPHLVVNGATDAIDFYRRAFGAVELLRVPAPDGKLMHACLRIGDSAVMLVDEFPEWNSLGPKSRNGTSVTIHLYVEDADALAQRAVAAGAKVVMPVQEMFWGDRYGLVEDPFGHQWSIATHVRDVSPEELQKGAQNAGCG